MTNTNNLGYYFIDTISVIIKKMIDLKKNEILKQKSYKSTVSQIISFDIGRN